MIKDALEYLVNLGRKTCAAERMALPGGRVLVTLPGGEVMDIRDDPTPIVDRLETLGDLIAWLNEHASVDGETCIFVDRRRVVALVHRELSHLTKRAIVELTPSVARVALDRWLAAESGYSQAAVVRLLRGELMDCYNPEILPIFRRLDFERRKQSAGAVTHARESLGRTVEALAQSSEGDIPETLLVTLPWTVHPEGGKVPLRLAVQVSGDTETIRVYPEGDCIERSERGTLERIHEFLVRAVDIESVTVYRGEAK